MLNARAAAQFKVDTFRSGLAELFSRRLELKYTDIYESFIWEPCMAFPLFRQTLFGRRNFKLTLDTCLVTYCYKMRYPKIKSLYIEWK